MSVLRHVKACCAPIVDELCRCVREMRRHVCLPDGLACGRETTISDDCVRHVVVCVCGEEHVVAWGPNDSAPVAWQPTPPSEAGWYWATAPDGRGVRWVEVVHWDPRFGAYETGSEALVEAPGSGSPPTCADWLWWPIPLTPPEVAQ